MSREEYVKRVRATITAARASVKATRALLDAAETLLSAAEELLGEDAPNPLRVRRALDAVVAAQRAANEALLTVAESADQVLDALGVGTRLLR